jgi:hypothetical protein
VDNLDLTGLAHLPDRCSSQIILTTYSASGERIHAETKRVARLNALNIRVIREGDQDGLQHDLVAASSTPISLRGTG